MADLSWFRLSAGLSLLSKPMISNFTPAGLLLLVSSARYCRVFNWLEPTGAIKPDKGSIQAILTVSPFWAKAFKDNKLVSVKASQVFFDAIQVS